MAVHGYWCGATTRPGRCPSCSSPIFYFSCECSSKVFFDELSGEWPKHRCGSDESGIPSWVRDLERVVDPDGRSVVDLGNNISVQRPGRSANPVSVPRPRAPRPKALDMPIVRVDPSGSVAIEVIGTLREISAEASLLKSLELGDNDIAREMLAEQLGPEWRHQLSRITIHSTPDDEGQRKSYTAWVTRSQLSNSRMRRGSTVSALLASVDVLQMGREWLCAHLFLE